MNEGYHPEKSRSLPKKGDNLPQGSIAVLKTAAAITTELVEEHPEIADLYRDTMLTKMEIAEQVMPDLVKIYLSATRAAIGNVLGELLSREERAAIGTQRKKAVGSKNIQNIRRDFSEEEFRARQSAAAKKGHEKRSVDFEAMARAKGVTLWKPDEKQFAVFLRSHSEYLHQEGRSKGRPNISKIAEAINIAFHQGEAVRDKNSIKRLASILKKKKE